MSKEKAARPENATGTFSPMSPETELESGVPMLSPPPLQLYASEDSDMPPSTFHLPKDIKVLSDGDLDKKIAELQHYLEWNGRQAIENVKLLEALMEMRDEANKRKGIAPNRKRLSHRQHNDLAKKSRYRRGKIIDKQVSPNNHEMGKGGWIPQTAENVSLFKTYFNPLLPPGATLDDLMVLSSDFSKYNANFKELPPPDLWPNMKKTLALIRTIFAESGIQFKIKSAYRSDLVNALSGGHTVSKHMSFSAVDISPPESEQKKASAFLKYFWYAQGKGSQMKLRYYSKSRQHIDTTTYTRAKWSDTRNDSKKRFQRYFPEKSL